MDLAEHQSALSWSLRVAASRARLAVDPETRAHAISELKRIYARFMEGFETSDLRDVREIVQGFAEHGRRRLAPGWHHRSPNVLFRAAGTLPPLATANGL